MMDPYFSFFFLIFYYGSISVDCLLLAEDITVREGESVNLFCQYQGAQMSWRYYTSEYDNQGEIVADGLQVPENLQGQFAVYYSQIERIYGLRIEKPKLSNTGYYKCAYFNSLVSTSILRVASFDAPSCAVFFLDLADSQAAFARVNDSVLLSCKSGFESNYPKIRWLRGSNFTNVEEADRLNILHHPMTLKKIDEDVTFTCVLGEGDVRSSPSCSVTPLLSQPIVSIVPAVASGKEGENAIFECMGRVNSGNITYDWDETTLKQFEGRYLLNTDKTELRISDLKASDNATNVTCLVTVDTGTRGSSVATLRVTTDRKNSRNGDLSGGNENSEEGRTETGVIAGGNTGLIIGLMSVSAITILAVTVLILIISRRKKCKNHPTPSPPRIESANFDEGVVRKTSQYYDYSGEYAVSKPALVSDTENNGQVAFVVNGYKSSGSQVTYAVAGQYEVPGDEERAMNSYDEVDRSKASQQQGVSFIPEYQVIENSNDYAPPVYAEVNKGKTEQSPSEDRTNEMYAEVDKHDITLPKTANQTVTEVKITEKPDYAKVNKKIKDNKAQADDGYAKPDFSVSDETTGAVCGEDVSKEGPASPALYAEVQKSDLKGVETDTSRNDGNGKEKPKYAKVNKKPKI